MALSVLACGPANTAVVPASFEGSWVIADYRERGQLTRAKDGEPVTIRRSGDFYVVDAPDWVVDEARFSAKGSKLEGATVQDHESLKQIFSDSPPAVVSQAAASKSAVYHATMEMRRDGQLQVSRNNLRIVYTPAGRFTGFEDYPGWITFTLRRR